MFFKNGKYIAVEGVIGVGKTTLASILAKKYGGKLYKEVVEENPFLENFYMDQEKYAFQAQIFFLLSRFRQQKEMLQSDLFSKFIISDYFMEKDRIFAYINLDEKELSLYEILWTYLSKEVAKPDLIIYLQAKTDVLMERIKKRGRPFEVDISPDYIEKLNQAYNYFFFHFNETNLMVIKTDDIDFVDNPEDMEIIINELEKFEGGRKYFDPLNVKNNGKK